MIKTEDQVRAIADTAMRNARENGFFLSSRLSYDEVEAICVDMLDCDADCEGLEVEQLRPHVTAFFRRTGQYRGE